MNNPSLKQKLNGLGLTDELLAKVVEGMGGAMEQESDWALVSSDDLVGFGVPLIVARKIDNEFNLEDKTQQATAVVAKEVPENTGAESMAKMAEAVVQMANSQNAALQGDLTKVSLTNLITRFLGGEKELEMRQELTSRLNKSIGTTKIFVQNSNGEGINAEATSELVEEKTSDVDFNIPEVYSGGMVITLEEVINRQRSANPITGEALAKGAHWLTVSEEHRALVAYARLSNDQVIDGIDELTMIDELTREKLPVRWSDLKVKFQAQKSKSTPLYLQAVAALTYRKEANTSAGNSVVPNSTEEQEAKEFVMGIAEKNGVRNVDSGISSGINGICKTLVVSGGTSLKFNIIATTAVKFSGGLSLKGNVYTPNDCVFNQEGGTSNNVKQVRLSWSKLKQMIENNEV